jgi:hypothetical protein
MSTSKNIHTFPWGIYIGNLMDNGNRLPLYLQSSKGGFTLLFDQNSETDANNFIENITLKLFETLPINDINVDIFDFSYKKRFNDLSLLKEKNLYNISLTPEDAEKRFDELKKISLYRHHELLSPTVVSISDFNQLNKKIENYYILLINLEHFPNCLSKNNEIEDFFESAYEVGFYIIAFGDQNRIQLQHKGTEYIINRYPHIKFKNSKIVFDKQSFDFYDLTQQYEFKQVDDNKREIIEKLLKSSDTESETV